ncbi:glycosyltransferase family A protein [Bacillus sp. AFS040349]|uniref:glycosyltransferase family A protein n=1 Tax=Bacillus sp. AFS040349 TaxID=2033502 RepID=UPI000BFD0ED5|nr:glycosyltransferase family A protein [Bacillus sp. AFS040349]PGT89047.1 hypothetical protein COD11_05060 [Bacillus sp. AFS040349]
MEKVSIIIPVYNAESSLNMCLKSICNQTYKNLEVILINDGSTDKSKELCESFIQNDKRLFLLNKDNSGPSDTRNLGISISTGKYLMFIDSDDFIDIDYVEKMVNSMILSNSDIVVSGFTKENRGTIEKVCSQEKTYHNISDAAYELFKKNLFGYSWNKLIKREIVTQNSIYFDKDINLFEDQYFYCRYFEAISSVHVSSNCGYHYIIETNTLATIYRENRFYLYNDMMLYLSNFFNNIKMSEVMSSHLLFEYSYSTLHHCISELAATQTIKNIKKKIQEWEPEFLVRYFKENYVNYSSGNTDLKSKILYFLLKQKSKSILAGFYKLLVSR